MKQPKQEKAKKARKIKQTLPILPLNQAIKRLGDNRARNKASKGTPYDKND